MTASDPVSSESGSVRLTFAYDDDGLRLARRTPRRKPARRGASLAAAPPGNAVVLELRAPDGGVRHRQLLVDPIAQTAEISDAGGRYHQVAVPRRSGGFSVVVPSSTEPVEVVVSAGPDVELAQPGLARPPDAPRRWRDLVRARLEGDDDGGE